MAPVDPGYVPTGHRGFPDNLDPPEPDGLPELEVKPHSLAKLRAVGGYSNAFTTALKKEGRPTAYLDLFAGPGLLRDKTTKELRWGTPQLALQCPARFVHMVLVERDATRAQALTLRVQKRARRGETVTVITDSAELCIAEVVLQVPRVAFALTIVDPFRLEVGAETLRELVVERRIDLIVLFPDGVDLKRNLDRALKGDPAHLPRFNAAFGSNWHQEVDRWGSAGRDAARLQRLYLTQLGSLGLVHQGRPLQVRMTNGPEIYQLLFASRSGFAANLWNDCTKQPQMEFELPA